MKRYTLVAIGAVLLIVYTIAYAGLPLAPSGVTVTANGCKNNRVAWTDNQGTGTNAETGFRVERGPSGGAGPWSTVGTVPANFTAFTNLPTDSLPPVEDVTYTYRSCATNVSGSSCSTASANFLTPLCAPTGLTVAALLSSCTKLRLNWTDNSTVNTHYSIERRLANSGAFTVVTNITLQTGPYDDPGLTGATLYGYRIRASNSVSGSVSGYSTTNAATTTACNATK